MRYGQMISLLMVSAVLIGTLGGCEKLISSSKNTGSGNSGSSKGSVISMTSSVTSMNSSSVSSQTQSSFDGNYILDTSFSGGATVFAPIKPPITISGKLDFGKNITGKTTQWILTQWNSLNNIIKTSGQRVGDTYEYANSNKTIGVSDDGTVTFIYNASKDYLQPRTSPQDPWSHLYFEQHYSDQDEARNLGKYKSVNVTYNFEIPFCNNLTPKDVYNPDIHASIAVFYLILQDINPSSPGYGDFINFCMPLFDDRVDIPKKEWHMDSGTDPNDATNKMVYTMDGNILYNSPTGDGKWHNVNIDIMPYIKEAFNIAKNNNCMKNTQFSDIGLGSFFFGFENTGMFDSELKINNMSIRVN